jgi:hypothetical protein
VVVCHRPRHRVRCRVYEQRVIHLEWFGGSGKTGLRVNSEAMRRADTGRRFWVYVTTVPLTLLTFASMAVALDSQGPVRDWWLGADVITVLERLGTFFFFIPTALRLMPAETLPESGTMAMASRWVQLNRIRIILNLAGWLAALKALSLSSTLNR